MNRNQPYTGNAFNSVKIWNFKYKIANEMLIFLYKKCILNYPLIVGGKIQSR